MMHYYLCLMLSLFSLNVYAGATGQMSETEQQQIATASIEYHECLNEFALSQLEHHSDPRVIADHSMKTCAPILEKLYNELLSSDYPPQSLQRLVNRMSSKGANKLLSNLMRYMATRTDQ